MEVKSGFLDNRKRQISIVSFLPSFIVHLGKIMGRLVRRAGAAESQEQFLIGHQKNFLGLSFYACAHCWMQWRKLTIRILPFLSIQKKIFLYLYTLPVISWRKTTPEYSGNFENSVFFAKRLPVALPMYPVPFLLFAGEPLERFDNNAGGVVGPGFVESRVKASENDSTTIVAMLFPETQKDLSVCTIYSTLSIFYTIGVLIDGLDISLPDDTAMSSRESQDEADLSSWSCQKELSNEWNVG
jgi:hypothetical protein